MSVLKLHAVLHACPEAANSSVPHVGRPQIGVLDRMCRKVEKALFHGNGGGIFAFVALMWRIALTAAWHRASPSEDDGTFAAQQVCTFSFEAIDCVYGRRGPKGSSWLVVRLHMGPCLCLCACARVSFFLAFWCVGFECCCKVYRAELPRTPR